MIGIVGFMLLCAPVLQVTGFYINNQNELKLMQYQQFNSLDVQITKPLQGYFYANNQKLFPLLFFTVIVGSITFEASVSAGTVEKVEFFVGTELKHTDYYEPFIWNYDDSGLLKHTITVKAYDYEGNSGETKLPVWTFKGKEPNAVPEPVIVEPAGNGLLFDPLWKTMIISENTVFIRAFESTNAEDIVSTLFEYSTDETFWTSVGTDSHGGFQGMFLSDGENQKIGDEGWGVRWDLSSISEGTYYLRATMTDERGQTGQATKKIYYDPVPPIPLIITPSYGEIINGLTTFQATTAADNVKSMILYLINSSQGVRDGAGWYNQSGLGNTQQGGVGPNGKDGANHFCAPTAVANGLAGRNNPGLYPPGQAGNNTALAKALAGNMSTTVDNGTNPWRSTGGPNLERETDNVGAGIRAYLEGRGVGCSNESGYEVTLYKTKIQYNATSGNCYPVTGSNGIDWVAYNNEIRNGEAVILDIHPLDNGPDGMPGTPDDTLGGGHSVTGRGSNADENPDGTHSIGYVDPGNGQNYTTTWANNSGFSFIRLGNAWWLITGMWAISPKKSGTLQTVGIDTDPTDGYNVCWDTTTVPNGFYTLIVDMKDSNGFIGRRGIVVEVDNTPPYSWVDPSGGPVYSNTMISIHATDEGGSGVALIHYEIWVNGNPVVIEEYPGDTAQFHFGQYGIFEGPADLIFWAMDNAGNIEEPNMTNYIVLPE